jgi:hypothetical protein
LDTDKPLCDLTKEQRDEDGCVSSALLQKLDLTKCRLEKDTCFSMEEADPKPPPRRKAVEPAAAPPLKESPVEEVQVKEAPVLLASNEPAPTAVEVAAPAPAKTVESVGVDAAIGQVKALLPADASAGVLVGGAAALAVVGAAIKLGPSMLKARAEKASQEHEREMRKLEIEEKKAEQGEDQHKQCGMARMALEAKVAEQAGQLASLSAKLSEVESKASAKSESSIDLDGFDPSEMQERLEALEKLLKKQAPAPAKKGKAKKA